MKHETPASRPYVRPRIESVSARDLVESLGPAHGHNCASGANDDSPSGGTLSGSRMGGRR